MYEKGAEGTSGNDGGARFNVGERLKKGARVAQTQQRGRVELHVQVLLGAHPHPPVVAERITFRSCQYLCAAELPADPPGFGYMLARTSLVLHVLLLTPNPAKEKA